MSAETETTLTSSYTMALTITSSLKPTQASYLTGLYDATVNMCNKTNTNFYMTAWSRSHEKEFVEFIQRKFCRNYTGRITLAPHKFKEVLVILYTKRYISYLSDEEYDEIVRDEDSTIIVAPKVLDNYKTQSDI